MIFNIGIQLNSLKKLCEKNLEEVLKTVSSLGFHGVEFKGFYGHSPYEIKALLKKYGLTLISSHLELSDILDNYDEHLAYHKELLCKRLVITFGEFSGAESLSMLINNLNSLQIRLRKQNIELLYHNHEHEFRNYKLGENALSRIMSDTKINLELDTFWAEKGGGDISEILEKYKNRIPLLHIKDGIGHIPTALGEGECDIRRVYNFGIENKLEWIILELSSKMEDPLTAMYNSVDYLNKL